MNPQRLPGRDFEVQGPYQISTREYLIARGHCCDSGCRHCPYKTPQTYGPRIICLVPSLTETLIAAGANVVGRTRFCIHPRDLVKKIPVVGGTKGLDQKLIDELHPDFVLMDKQENTREMAAQCTAHKVVATHVRSLEDLRLVFLDLARQLDQPMLLNLADRIRKLQSTNHTQNEIEKIPGILSWLRHPTAKTDRIAYVIWNNPAMCVAKNTFIGDMAGILGWSQRLWTPKTEELYPQFDWSDLPQNSLVLLSTEPYPFAKKQSEILSLIPQHCAVALVDGESYSWFGLRALRFLEDL